MVENGSSTKNELLLGLDTGDSNTRGLVGLFLESIPERDLDTMIKGVQLRRDLGNHFGQVIPTEEQIVDFAYNKGITRLPVIERAANALLRRDVITPTNDRVRSILMNRAGADSWA